MAKSTIQQILIFLLFSVNFYNVWPSGRDHFFCLYLKIPENFIRLVLKNEFWFVHILFGRMVRFQFLTQYPIDFLFLFRRIESSTFLALVLLHSLIMWWIVLSQSPHNLHLLFCCIFLLSLFLSSFFPTRLNSGLLLEYECQQISSSLQDSSLYYGRSKQWCSLDSVCSSSKSFS